MRNKLAATVVMLILGLVGVAFAKPTTKVHPEGVTMDIPDGWKFAETDAPKPWSGKVWLIVGPEGADKEPELVFMVMTAKATKMEAAIKDLETFLADKLNTIKWEAKPETIKLDGMDAVALDGTAFDKKKKLEIGVLVLATPTGKGLVLFGGVVEKVKSKYEAPTLKMLTSIRKSKK